jgi:hypothetical protein
VKKDGDARLGSNITETNNETSAEAKKEEIFVAQAKPVETKEEPVDQQRETVVPKNETLASTSVASTTQQSSQPFANTKNEDKTIDLLAPVAETSNEGAFAEFFPVDAPAKSLTNKTGDAATFKTTSGWQDKKYYALINNVPPGTILKIASGDNKVIFAKVLGAMPEMKENKGLLLRLSNAAAAYLGMVEGKFPVQVSFYQ